MGKVTRKRYTAELKAQVTEASSCGLEQTIRLGIPGFEKASISTGYISSS